jgi:hypothetical protein
MKPRPRLIRRARQSGSAVLAALSILAVTAVVVGIALSEARNRFHTSHHSQRWTQAQHAAEAGVELALMSAQKAAWTADGWPAAPGDAGAAPVSKTFALSAGVPAGGPVSATVAVDKVTLSGADWLRIRSTGQAEVFGGAVAGQDTQDVLLRKLSLRHDRRTGQSVGTPQATRTVEILAEPTQRRPFTTTFIAKSVPTLGAKTTTDSYDSSEPTKSNFAPFTHYGIYDASKSQSNGSVATTSQSLWDLNSATISGDVLTPSADVTNTGEVDGTVADGFDFTFPHETSPNWPTVTENHGAVANVSVTLTGGPQDSPTRHKFNSINLTQAGKAIVVENPPGQTESWVEIWVTEDTVIGTAAETGIRFAPGVHATVYFGGNVQAGSGSGSGHRIRNESQRAENLVIHGYGGSSAATKKFTVSHGDFHGVVSAPWYSANFDAPGYHVHGSFLVSQFAATDGTHLHYDEALADLGIGEFSVWKVASWVEAVR